MIHLLPDAVLADERLRYRLQEPAPPAFERLGRIHQLDAMEIACRSPFYAAARSEALPESDEYGDLLQMLTDSTITDSAIGAKAREILTAYMQRVAERRGEDLAGFVR
jgi:hypothetical protein